ncbi:MAG: DUF4293 family protein [Bacteroidales bacterium]|nr:DUF4293 family protein [Bacteroidales bacterium]
MIIRWPRIQNVLLAICSALLLSMLWSDFCHAPLADGSRYSIKFTDSPQFLIFTFTTMVLGIVTIAYRKARILQIRLCIIEALLLIGYQGWIIVEFFKLKKAYSFSIATIFPMVCIILLLIAIKYIWRDEALDLSGDLTRRYRKRIEKRKAKGKRR